MLKVKPILLLCLLAALPVLSGCAETLPSDTFRAESIAAAGKLRRTVIPANGFQMTAFVRVTDVNEPLAIYIEGEDRPYVLSGSIDPTPQRLLGLQLAALDPAANVLYIARPCQISRDESRCAAEIVRNGRFGDMSYHSVSRVINRVLAPFPKPRLHLNGVGNGGALAALLAERRSDVVSLRTVGGNLDPTGLARYLGYDGADDLVDPMPNAARLASLPQEHYVGDKDAVVPAFLTANFLAEMGKTYCATLVRVPEATHDEGWPDIWRANVGARPTCGQKQFKFNAAE